jgi:hypothetical protein
VLEGKEYRFFDNQNIPVYFFMSVVVALFFGLTMSAEEIFKDRKILKREKFLNLSRSSYLTSKVGVMFSISAIQTLLFMAVGNSILEIPLTEFRYWFILFTTSCFANLLGLNISSAFKSAVTIYILIPLLVIPQLLLSGVVINFDRFNPKVGKPIGVPFMGEIMASRWAFEAYMVTQFKDNPFEKKFYELDQTAAVAEYKKVYLIPELESKLAYCLNNRQNWRNPNDGTMVRSLELLQNEIQAELRLVGEDKLPDVKNLVVGLFDSTVYRNTANFLYTLKQFYTNKMTRAFDEKERLISVLTATPEKEKAFNEHRNKFVNEAVSSAVKNMTSAERIVEYDGRLTQKIYPIYIREPHPRHYFDFSANLFQPVKHFGNRIYDTLTFNMAVIWSMTAFLYIVLYFDLLKRLVRFIENSRKYRKIDF